jgi:hypothetical protein
MSLPSRLATPAVERRVPGNEDIPQLWRDASQAMNDHDTGGARLAGEEGCVQSARDEWPEGSAPCGVLAEHTADEDRGLADSGWDRDRMVVVWVGLCADDREKKGEKGRDVWQAGRVVLYTAAQGGELRERRLAAGEKVLQESCQLGFLFGGNGERAEEGVHNHAGVSDALRRGLALVVTEADSGRGQAPPPGDASSAGPLLGAFGLARKMRADRVATEQAEAGRVWRGLGEIDCIVHLHGAVQGRGVETARRSGGEGHHRGVNLRLRGTGRAERGRRRRRPTRERTLDGAHQGIEGRAGVALAEVSRGESADKTVNADANHGLVAETEAGVDVAAHDEAPAGDHPAVLVNGEHAGPERPTGAARKDAEVIGIPGPQRT